MSNIEESNKRRAPGTENKKKETKRQRLSGLEYENRNKKLVPAKKAPDFEVRLYFYFKR